MAKYAKFIGRFKAPTIQKQAWTAALDRILSKEIEKAGAVWLNATVLMVIPVWSGASRATFKKLATALTVPLTITGTTSLGNRFAGLGSRWGPSVGFQKSEGQVNRGTIPGVYTFKYSTTLWHLIYNEYNDANASPQAGRLFSRLRQPGPYDFQKFGQDAFEDYAREVTLPSPWRKSYMKIKRIRVG